MTVEILSTVVNCMPTKNPVCKDLLEGVTQTLRNRGYHNRGRKLGSCPGASTSKGLPQKTVKNYYLRKHKQQKFTARRTPCCQQRNEELQEEMPTEVYTDLYRRGRRSSHLCWSALCDSVRKYVFYGSFQTSKTRFYVFFQLTFLKT